MRKSTIPFLIIKFLAAALCVSCGSNPVKDLKQTAADTTVYDAVYFSNPEIDYVYKTSITVYGNALSGIFIAKKINDTIHRVVFTTEFGNKLLDFEISETEFKINSIVDELDRKILINTLRDDFRLLLRKNYAVQEQFESGNSKIYKSQDGNRYNYIFVSKDERKLQKIVHASKRKQKLYIGFDSENNIFAEHIVIQHDNIKLKIELNYFKNQ